MRNSSQAPSAATTPSSAPSAPRPRYAAASTTGMATIATRTRLVSSLTIGRSGGDAAEAAVAPLELEQGVVQLPAAEVRPEHGRDHELGVGQLPEQEVADALFARRADEQVGIGACRRCRAASRTPPRRCRRAPGDRPRPRARAPAPPRTSSARPPYEMKRLSSRPSFVAVLDTTRVDGSGGGRRQAREVAEHAHANAAAAELIGLARDVLLEQRMSAETSVGGRCQFSCEKANSDRISTPASAAASTTSRTAFMPERWPNGRGNRRARAQRPLPSMMMATWRGTGLSRSRASGSSREPAQAR